LGVGDWGLRVEGWNEPLLAVGSLLSLSLDTFPSVCPFLPPSPSPSPSPSSLSLSSLLPPTLDLLRRDAHRGDEDDVIHASLGQGSAESKEGRGGEGRGNVMSGGARFSRFVADTNDTCRPHVRHLRVSDAE
jgi:hypothetical protein